MITEDDHFDYLIALTKKLTETPPGIPNAVSGTWSKNALVFLGFQLDAWAFRVLFRSIVQQEGWRSVRDADQSVAVQIGPEEGANLNPTAVRRYIEKYFNEFLNSKIGMYWAAPPTSWRVCGLTGQAPVPPGPQLKRREMVLVPSRVPSPEGPDDGHDPGGGKPVRRTAAVRHGRDTLRPGLGSRRAARPAAVTADRAPPLALGAGKTSLIQAALMPALVREGMKCPAVAGEVPRYGEFSGAEADPGRLRAPAGTCEGGRCNRYAFTPCSRSTDF